MPDEQTLPPGRLRDLTLAVHDLYRTAGRPPVRVIAGRILDNDALRATVSYESVRAVLKGRLTRWDVLEAVAHQLALMAHPPQEPSTVIATLIKYWNRANEVMAGDVTDVVRGLPGSLETGSAGWIGPEADLDELLNEMDQVLEENPEEVVRGYVQQRGGVDETEEIRKILLAYPDIVPLLAAPADCEPSEELLVDLLTALFALFTGKFDSAGRLDSTEDEEVRDLARAAVATAEAEIDVPTLLRSLQGPSSPDIHLDYHLQSKDRRFLRLFYDVMARHPATERNFSTKLEDLVQLARYRASGSMLTVLVSEEGAEAENAYRQAIAGRRYEEARVAYEVLAGQNADRAADLRRQTGFLWFDDDRDRDIMAGLWSHLAVGNAARPEIKDVQLVGSATPRPDREPAMAHGTSPTGPAATGLRQGARQAVTGTARRHGDLDPAVLLPRLFELADDRLAGLVERLTRAGRAGARSCEFRAAPVNVAASSCHVLCYRSPKPLTLRALAPELMRREAILATDGVDHLVVLSLGAEIDAELQELAENWNARGAYPFAVRLFGVSALRSAMARPEIVQNALMPRLQLAAGWLRYVRDPTLLAFPGEEHEPLDSTYRAQLSTRFADDRGTPLPGTAFDHVQEWLDGDRQGLVVVGDFGDGKTFFTYNLARRLCETSLSVPDRVCVPLRLALKDLPVARNAHDLLRRRLDDLGMRPADWHLLVNSRPTLVILDGFDEMSMDLTREGVLNNIKLLRDCYQLFRTSKILLTSRGRAFGPPADQQRLMERIGDPEIVHLRPFERSDVLKSLYGSADAEQRRKVGRLQSLHDPIGMATKPLYHSMIRDILPDLPQENFTEEVLYEKYVSRTLQRKLEYLEDEQFQVRRADIVQNLLSILERVATELHRTNAPYVYLKDLDLRGLAGGGSGHGLAHVLWRTREGVAEGASDEDATARVGIRSLLKGYPGGAAERWPVDFSHRSMREYFVARAVARATTAGPDEPPALLWQARLSPEILRFASLILHNGREEVVSDRLERWARSVAIDDDPSPLGANALSLLFAYLGEVPGRDWSGLRLDYVQLAGADLESRSFRGSSLRHANLDNANLTDADLTDADLSGVRLEETASVTAVAVGPADKIYVAYGDLSLRTWEIGPGRVTDRVLWTLSHRVDRLWLTPGQRLAAVGDSSLTLLNDVDGEVREDAVFRVKSRYRSPDFADSMALLADEGTGGAARLVWFDPTTDTGRKIDLPDLETWAVLGELGYVAASTGRILVDLDDLQMEWPDELVSAVALRVDPSGEFVVATGHQDGTVGLLRLDRTATDVRRAKVWRRPLHIGPVTAVAFLGTDRLLTGGVDRSLCVVSTSTVAEDPASVVRLRLTLRCRGVRVDGMRGDRERNMLRRLAARE